MIRRSLLALAAGLVAAAVHTRLPTVQLQFSTRVETTAHRLNATEDYPPYKRYFTVYFDFPVRRRLPAGELCSSSAGSSSTS